MLAFALMSYVVPLRVRRWYCIETPKRSLSWADRLWSWWEFEDGYVVSDLHMKEGVIAWEMYTDDGTGSHSTTEKSRWQIRVATTAVGYQGDSRSMGTPLTTSSLWELYYHHSTPMSMLVVWRPNLRPVYSKSWKISEMHSGTFLLLCLSSAKLPDQQSQEPRRWCSELTIFGPEDDTVIFFYVNQFGKTTGPRW